MHTFKTSKNLFLKLSTSEAALQVCMSTPYTLVMSAFIIIRGHFILQLIRCVCSWATLNKTNEYLIGNVNKWTNARVWETLQKRLAQQFLTHTQEVMKTDSVNICKYLCILVYWQVSTREMSPDFSRTEKKKKKVPTNVTHITKFNYIIFHPLRETDLTTNLRTTYYQSQLLIYLTKNQEIKIKSNPAAPKAVNRLEKNMLTFSDSINSKRNNCQQVFTRSFVYLNKRSSVKLLHSEINILNEIRLLVSKQA